MPQGRRLLDEREQKLIVPNRAESESISDCAGLVSGSPGIVALEVEQGEITIGEDGSHVVDARLTLRQ